MTPEEIRLEIVVDPVLVALVPDTEAIAAALSTRHTRLIERLITERRILSVLGLVDGEAFLSALETFATQLLPDAHPLKAAQPGLKRVLSWLKTPDGLDVGDPLAQQMLQALAGAGVVNATHAQLVMDLARVPVTVSEWDVRRALWADDGTLLI